jgi:tetratricopeptide (TPR) repeat protein
MQVGIKIKYVLALFLFLKGTDKLLAQKEVVDSLKTCLKSNVHDTMKLKALDHLIEFEEDDKVWIVYNSEMKQIAEKNLRSSGLSDHLRKAYLSYIADTWNNLGFLEQQKGNVNPALEYFNKSISIREEIGDKQGIANSLNNLGIIYHNLGQVEKGLDCLIRALTILEELHFDPGVASTSGNIAFILETQSHHEEALNYFNKALTIQKKIKDREGEATSLNNIGAVYKEMNSLEKAGLYLQQALKIREEIEDKHGIAQSLYNIGLLLREQNKIQEALEYYNKSLKIQEEIPDKQGMAYSLNSISGLLLLDGKVGEAETYGVKGLSVARDLAYPDIIANSAELLKKIYQKQNKQQQALEMFDLYVKMHDSINNEQTRKSGIQKQLKYEYEKKTLTDNIKVVEQRKITDSNLKRQTTKRYALSGGLLLTLLFAAFMLNRVRIIRKQKNSIEEQKKIIEKQRDLVEEKQKEILDSILYARRIQRALITPENYFEKNLERLIK